MPVLLNNQSLGFKVCSHQFKDCRLKWLQLPHLCQDQRGGINRQTRGNYQVRVQQGEEDTQAKVRLEDELWSISNNKLSNRQTWSILLILTKLKRSLQLNSNPLVRQKLKMIKMKKSTMRNIMSMTMKSMNKRSKRMESRIKMMMFDI